MGIDPGTWRSIFEFPHHLSLRGMEIRDVPEHIKCVIIIRNKQALYLTMKQKKPTLCPLVRSKFDFAQNHCNSKCPFIKLSSKQALFCMPTTKKIKWILIYMSLIWFQVNKPKESAYAVSYWCSCFKNDLLPAEDSALNRENWHSQTDLVDRIRLTKAHGASNNAKNN